MSLPTKDSSFKREYKKYNMSILLRKRNMHFFTWQTSKELYTAKLYKNIVNELYKYI